MNEAGYRRIYSFLDDRAFYVLLCAMTLPILDSALFDVKGSGWL